MANLLAGIAPELCGIVRQRYAKCGKPGCKCRRGEFHGPYYVLQYRAYSPGKGWVKKTKYIRKEDVKRVRAELMEARRFTKKAIQDRYRELVDSIGQLEAYVLGGINNVQEA